MNTHDATEQAYKNGYEAGFAMGYKAARDKIVHCKDCKYLTKYKDMWICRIWKNLENMGSERFCSLGKRKDEE